MSQNIIRRKKLETKIGFARSTIYAKLSPHSSQYDPTFPKPIHLGNGRAIGWLENEVEAWLTQQVESSRIRSINKVSMLKD